MRYTVQFVFILFFTNLVNGQYIDGYIYNETNREPIDNVLVSLIKNGELMDSTYSDELGYYGFEVTSKDKFRVYFKKPNFGEKWYADFSNDKKPRKVFLTSKLPIDFKPYYKKAHFLKDNENAFIEPSVISKSHYTYDDPLRYFENLLGVSQFNDQSNAYDYQGIPARFQKYFLNGIEIFNPNIYPVIGSHNGIINRNGGMALSIPNIASLSFGNNKNNFNTSSIGANLAMEIQDFDSFGKISNLGIECAKYSNKFKLAVKVAMPNVLSRVGNDNGFQQGGGVSALLNSRKIRKNRLVEYIIMYSLSGMQSYRNPLKDDANSSEIIEYFAPSQNLHISRIFHKNRLRTEFGSNFYVAAADLSFTNQLGIIDTGSYQFRISNYMGFRYFDDESSFFGMNLNLNTFHSSEDVESLELVSVPQFEIRYHNLFPIGKKKIIMTISPTIYSFDKVTFSPDFQLAFLNEKKFDYSISHNSQIDELTGYFGNIIKALNFEGKHYIQIGENNRFTINPFVHLFYNFDNKKDTYVPLNHNDLFVHSTNQFFPYRSLGLSLAYDVNLGNGYEITANCTLLNAKFHAGNNWVFSDLSYSVRSNAALNKVFILPKKKSLQISLRLSSLIGARSFYPYIGEQTQYSLGAIGQKRDNYRIDTQIRYQGKFGVLSLSVSNLLNTDNPGYPIFDPVDRKYKNSNQTKFLPVISYTFDL